MMPTIIQPKPPLPEPDLSVGFGVEREEFVSMATLVAHRRAAIAAAAPAIRRAERGRAIAIVESHKVSVGNSRAGELAAEWTMDSLREVRDAIRALPEEP